MVTLLLPFSMSLNIGESSHCYFDRPGNNSIRIFQMQFLGTILDLKLDRSRFRSIHIVNMVTQSNPVLRFIYYTEEVMKIWLKEICIRGRNLLFPRALARVKNSTHASTPILVVFKYSKGCQVLTTLGKQHVPIGNWNAVDFIQPSPLLVWLSYKYA